MTGPEGDCPSGLSSVVRTALFCGRKIAFGGKVLCRLRVRFLQLTDTVSQDGVDGNVVRREEIEWSGQKRAN
jgi:hypothetical protein